MKKRIFSLVLAVLMLFSFNMGARAESMVQPRYNYAISVTPGLSVSSAQANCSAVVTGVTEVTKIKVKIILQEKGLLKWNNVTTWNDEANSTRFSANYHYGPVDSGKYRVKVEVTMYVGTASETISATSSTVTV